jgi:RNA-directed DNA polymerase
MNLATPSSVQKLQKALHDKAKGSPSFRFYALYDKVYRKDVLAFAYQCCKAKGGAAGVDGQSFQGIEEYGVERWLDELAQELKSQNYRPLPVRRVYIPKPDGKQRPLGVPLSAIGRRKRQQCWCSSRYSRPICSRSNMPIGKTAVHWTP